MVSILTALILFFKNRDMFGKQIPILYKGDGAHKSLLGGVFSLIIVGLICYSCYQFVLGFFYHEMQSVISRQELKPNSPEMSLLDDRVFPFFFLVNPSTFQSITT